MGTKSQCLSVKQESDIQELITRQEVKKRMSCMERNLRQTTEPTTISLSIFLLEDEGQTTNKRSTRPSHSSGIRSLPRTVTYIHSHALHLRHRKRSSSYSSSLVQPTFLTHDDPSFNHQSFLTLCLPIHADDMTVCGWIAFQTYRRIILLTILDPKI
jgi:hypothetical protein